jgi:flagellar protein FliO/FliZ
MDLLRPDQILTLTLFMAALGAAWWWVHRNRAALEGRLGNKRRISVLESTALGPQDRAMILRVDGQEFMLLRLKGVPPLLQPLVSAPQTQTQTEAEA